jgi:hypothetical protein
MGTKGARKMAYIRKGLESCMAFNVLLSYNLAVVFNFNVFPFPQSKAQFLDIEPMNRQTTANCSSPRRDKKS